MDSCADLKFIPSPFELLQFVMETWRLMDSKDISVNNICFSLMMQALCKRGYTEEVK